MNSSLYRSVWRWHFYAGLIVLPVLAWMAITGALYLYKPELERALYGSWINVPAASAAMPLDQAIARAGEQTGGRITQVRIPASGDESLRMAIEVSEGEGALAFVRAGDGAVLGTTGEGGPLEIIKQLHSLAIAGPIANVLVEIVAGWAIILVVTGFYLWWPRRGAKALTLAGHPRERRFWRNAHSTIGFLAGGIIFFLALTGLPWTAFWGGNFHRIVAEQQIGRPAPPVAASAAAGHEDHLPWSMQHQAAPAGGGTGDIGAEAAARTAIASGMSAPFYLDLPKEAGKPYRAVVEATRAEDARIMYVDAASGAVLQDARSGDFGIGARLFDWGIYTHQGQQYGEVNRLLMLFGCIGVVLLAVSAPMMWLKRRRQGRLDAPPAPSDQRVARNLTIGMVGLGILLPLTGATMLVAGATSLIRSRR